MDEGREYTLLLRWTLWETARVCCPCGVKAFGAKLILGTDPEFPNILADEPR